MKRKAILIGFDLIAPGIGQIMGGMWLRGALQLLTAIVCALWCLAEVAGPIALSVRNMLSEDGGQMVMPNFWRVGASIGLLIFLYAWSILELAIIVKDEDAQKPGEASK